MRKSRSVVFAGMALILACSAASPVRAETIIRNGGFEEAAKHWWGPGVKADSVSSAQAAGGTKSLQVAGDFACQDKILVQGGTRYKISMKIRSDNAPEGAVYAQLSYRGGALQPGWFGPQMVSLGGREEKAVFVTGGNQDWKEFSTVVEAPEGATQMLLYLRKIPGTSGLAFFDEVSVVAGTEPAAAEKAIGGGKGIINGGFEQGFSGWWGGAVNKTAVIVAENATEGSKALKNSGDFVCQDKIPVTGGQRYKISMKMRAEGAPEGSVYVQLSYRGGKTQPDWYGPEFASIEGRSEKALYVTGGSVDWKEFSTVVQAPAAATQMLLYLRKLPGSAGAGYFDDIKIVPTDEPAAKEKAVQLSPDGQVVFNGGFEKGASGWWGGAVGKTGGVVEDGAAEGAKSLKITEDFACQDKRPVEEGKRYRISAKIRSDGAPEGSVYMQLSFRGESISGGWFGPDVVNVGGRKEPAVFVSGGTHEWREFSCVVEVPPTANQVLIYLRKLGKSEGAGYFDQVSILPTDEAPTTAADLRRKVLAKEWLAASLPEAEAKARLEKTVAESATATAGKLLLANNGAAQYRVHAGSDSHVVTLGAAHDLAVYLGKISGGDFLPLSHDNHPLAGPLLVVGRDNVLTAKLCPDIRYDELGEDGFVIRTVGRHIVIAGNTPGGTMYGVNWFLDHKLGVKWLSPDYTSVPAAKSIAINAVNEKQIPRFKFRQILSHEGQDKSFAARNLLNGNSHGAYGLLAAEEIKHWDNSWQRPGLVGSFYELVPDKPGLRYGGQVAMMNPEVRQIIADGIIKRLKGVSNYQNYWFGLMDNDWGWDMDPASAAFAKKHGDVASAAKVDLAIDVLQRVRKVLPKAKIAFNAYHWGFSPPTGMTIPEGLMVYPMTIHLDYSTPLNVGRNAKLGRDIEGWNAMSKDILLWDHTTNFNGYIQPTPNIYPICKTIQWLATLPNISGYFAEGSWNTRSAEFSSLRVWLMARMLWAPGTDFQAATAEYCDAYFGPAGKPLKHYIDLMHEASVKSGAEIWEKTNVDSKMFTLDFVTKADALFAQAEAAVASGDPVFLKHVRQARVCVDYVILLRRKEYQDLAAAKKLKFNTDFDNRLARLNQTVSDEKIKEYQQSGSIKSLADMIAIERNDTTPPEIVRGLPASDWAEVQDIGFNRYYGNTIVIADALASDGATARLDGKVGAPLIQLKHHKLPPEGKWDVYAAVRVDAEGVAPDAMALAVGSMPPQNNARNIKVGDLKSDGYTLVKAPGGPFRYNQDDQAVSFIRGGNAKVKYIYVDRFVLVRAK